MLLGVRDASAPNSSSGATSSLASGSVAIDFSVFLATSAVYDAGKPSEGYIVLLTLMVAQVITLDKEVDKPSLSPYRV